MLVLRKIFSVLLGVTRNMANLEMATSVAKQNQVSWILTFNPGYLPSSNISSHADSHNEAVSAKRRTKKQ